jgi:hypothetical protein
LEAALTPIVIDRDSLIDLTAEAYRLIDSQTKQYLGSGQDRVSYRFPKALAYTVTTATNLLVEFLSLRDCDVVVGLINDHLQRCETPYRLQPVA